MEKKLINYTNISDMLKNIPKQVKIDRFNDKISIVYSGRKSYKLKVNKPQKEVFMSEVVRKYYNQYNHVY